MRVYAYFIFSQDVKKKTKQAKIKDVKCHAKGLSKLKHT